MSSQRPSERVAIVTGRPRGTALARRCVPALAVDVGFLVVFWLLFFWPLIGRRTYLVPYDIIDQHYMFRAFFHRALVSGEAPWWAPHILAGYPIVADPLTMTFYPPALLMDVVAWRETLLPYYALEVFAVAHVLWAALGTYALARVLWRSRFGALVAALAFAFGGFFAWHLPHLSLLVALSWLPWVLLGYRQVLRAGWRWWVPLTALMYGLSILAGHAQTTLQTTVILIGLGIAVASVRVHRYVSDRLKEPSTSEPAGRWFVSWAAALLREAMPLWQALAIVALGASLAAVQLLPSLELAGYTERQRLTYEQATVSSLRPHWLVTMVLPNLFSARGPAPYWGSGDPAETNFFVGLVPLFLAVLGWVNAEPRRRPLVALLAGSGAVMLGLAFGDLGWLHRLAYDFVPGFDRVRRPVNFAAWAILALALLAAYGGGMLEREHAARASFLQWLRVALAVVGVGLVAGVVVLVASSQASTREIVEEVLDDLMIAGLVLVLTSGVLKVGERGARLGRLAAVVLLVIVAVDIARVTANASYRQHRRSPDSYIGLDWAGSPDDSLVRWLLDRRDEALPDRFRILPLEAGSIWENGPLVWEIDSASGYSVLWPVWYRDLFVAATAGRAERLLDLLGVRYVLSSKSLEELFTAEEAKSFRLVRDGSVRIYENADAWPRVWLAACAIPLSRDAQIPYRSDGSGTVGQTVVLDADTPIPVDMLCSAGESNSGLLDGSAEIVEYTNTRVSVRVRTQRSALLVLMDTFYPGWHVTVDGADAPLYRAEHAFRATLVPPGDHTVVFRYVAQPLRRGAIVTGLAALVTIVLLVASGLRRRDFRAG